MKLIRSIAGLAVFGGLFAACMGDNNDVEPVVPQLEPRIAPQEAVNRLATERCRREAECGNVGATERFSDQEHCLSMTRDEVARDMADDVDCKNGISNEDMNECLSEIRQARCEGVRGLIDAWQASMECNSSNLCLD